MPVVTVADAFSRTRLDAYPLYRLNVLVAIMAVVTEAAGAIH